MVQSYFWNVKMVKTYFIECLEHTNKWKRGYKMVGNKSVQLKKF